VDDFPGRRREEIRETRDAGRGHGFGSLPLQPRDALSAHSPDAPAKQREFDERSSLVSHFAPKSIRAVLLRYMPVLVPFAPDGEGPVNGAVLWANLHLLFWLSLFPFFTGWMGENHFHKLPTAAYGAVLLMAAIAYYILQTRIVAAQGPGSKLQEALGTDLKGKISPVVYLVAIPSAFVSQWIALALYVAVSIMWFIPDRRIESRIEPN
jgi:hypothetical protein